jgi:hypothetical protein
MSRKKPAKTPENVIAVNRRARHDYHIDDSFEAGLVLEGWEVKALRAGNAQIGEGYVNVRNGEAWLIGAHFSPLKTASTHVKADPTRTRKLLLHRSQLAAQNCWSASPGAKSSTTSGATPRIATGNGRKREFLKGNYKTICYTLFLEL